MLPAFLITLGIFAGLIVTYKAVNWFSESILDSGEVDAVLFGISVVIFCVAWVLVYFFMYGDVGCQ